MDRQQYAVKISGIRNKLHEMITKGFVVGRAGRFLQSAVETVDASLKRCVIYPHSPYYTNLVDQAKLTVGMMKKMMELEGAKSPELVSIMDDVVRLSNEYLSSLGRRTGDDIKLSTDA